MSRKQFIALAAMLREHNANAPKNMQFGAEQINVLMAFCEQQNPRFSRKKFFDAVFDVRLASGNGSLLRGECLQ